MKIDGTAGRYFLILAAFGWFFGGWWALAAFSGIPPYVLPPPQQVGVTLFRLLTTFDPGTRSLWQDIFDSLVRQFTGFAGAVVVGLPMGIACGYFGKAFLGFDRLVRVIYPIPSIAWVPLVLIWFGPGSSAITFMVFLASFWPIYMQSYEGARQLSIKYLRAAMSLGASRRSIVVSIIAPGGLPYLLNGLRLGYGESWRLLVAAEMLLATTGMGQIIQVSRSMLEVDKIIAGMIVVGLLGFLVERFVFDRIERVTLGKWYRRSQEATVG
jgi:ABC-type nitrate/sulfonate/bicarbonate transport system permease component